MNELTQPIDKATRSPNEHTIDSPSSSCEPPESGDKITLKALHQALEAAEVVISYKSLSDLIATDDVAKQLGGMGGRNRLAFPAASVEIVQGFLEYYRRRKGTRPNASRMLRQFLEKDTVEVVEDVNPTNLQVFNPPGNEMAAVMKEFIAAVKGITPVREDTAITRSQAAALLACSPGSVSRYVSPLRRGVYRRSDVMRYLASGVRPEQKGQSAS